MLDQGGAGQIINAVARRWDEIAGDPGNKAFASLPGRFWMNAAGGRAGAGKWVTVLMYTENDADAEAFRAVLQRWQARGSGGDASAGGGGGVGAAAPARGSPDLIQIGRSGAAGRAAADAPRPDRPADRAAGAAEDGDGASAAAGGLPGR